MGTVADLGNTGLRPSHALGFSALALLAALMLLSVHVGFQASDDINYVNGALGWLSGFPYVGDSHWTLRHTITIPTALFVSLFGLNQLAVSLTGMAYYVAFLVSNAWFAHRLLGARCALFASLMLIATPGFPVVSTYLSPDIPELFFVSLAFWLYLNAIAQRSSVGLWIAAGAVAGLGFVNRQTGIGLVLFLLAAFAFTPRAPRFRYLSLAVSMLVVVGADWGYLTWATGDPAYRIRVDFNHDVINRFANVASKGQWIDKEGNFSVNVFLDPVLTLLVSQKYTLLFWLSLPATLAAWRQRQSKVAPTLASLTALGLVAFLVVGANPKLYVVPRYFLVSAWAAAMLSSWWLAELWESGSRLVPIATMTLLLLANAVALSMENLHPRMVERALVGWVAAHPDGVIHTDIETRARSEFFFRFARLSMDNVSDAEPAAGDLFFYSEQRVEQCAHMPRCRNRAAQFRPGPTWQEQTRISGPLRPIAQPLRTLGLDKLLPVDIARRLLMPVGEVIVYKVNR
jgi:hypothetical protein